MSRTPWRTGSSRLLGIFAASLALTLTACGGGAQTSGTDDGSPVSGGTLRVGLGSDTSIINPQLTGSSVAALITRDVVDSLVAQGEDGSFQPWLATSWKISEDNKKYTFTLRDDVTFSDGEKLDAEAVKTNLDFVLDPKNNSTYGRSLLGPVSKVSAPDATTVTVDYKEPFAALLQGLSLPYLGILSPKFLDSGKDLPNSVVGSGPYVLDEWTVGQGSTLNRRDDYDWGPDTFEHTGPGYLDTIEYSYLGESGTRLGALKSGQVDAIDAIQPANFKEIDGTKGLTVDTVENPGVNQAIQLNTTKAPFDDEKVRKAFQVGVDIDSAVNATFFDTVKPAQGILAGSTEYVDESITGEWKNHPDEAGKLLDEAGWNETDSEGYRTKDGERLSIQWIYDQASFGEDNVNLAQALQSEYKKIGVDLKLESVDSGAAATRAENGDYDAYSYSYTRAEADILRTVYGSAAVGTGNSSRVESLDPQLDEAVGADAKRRAKLYAQVQNEVIDKAYSVPLYVPAFQFGRSDSLHGVQWATNAKPLFYNAWLDSSS